MMIQTTLIMPSTLSVSDVLALETIKDLNVLLRDTLSEHRRRRCRAIWRGHKHGRKVENGDQCGQCSSAGLPCVIFPDGTQKCLHCRNRGLVCVAQSASNAFNSPNFDPLLYGTQLDQVDRDVLAEWMSAVLDAPHGPPAVKDSGQPKRARSASLSDSDIEYAIASADTNDSDCHLGNRTKRRRRKPRPRVDSRITWLEVDDSIFTSPTSSFVSSAHCQSITSGRDEVPHSAVKSAKPNRAILKKRRPLVPNPLDPRSPLGLKSATPVKHALSQSSLPFRPRPILSEVLSPVFRQGSPANADNKSPTCQSKSPRARSISDLHDVHRTMLRRLGKGHAVGQGEVADLDDAYRALLSMSASSPALASIEKCLGTMKKRLASGIPISAGEVGDLEEAVKRVEEVFV